ncbi:MAG: hypothetical protein IJT16_08660 [Lachnospiraceae bacterium]|nr:hypothetical protein [Lachnospiraceae bacterium]
MKLTVLSYLIGRTGRARSEKPAEITVFLSLMLSVLLSFIYVLIRGSRLEASKYKIESAMDAGLTSCLSEYSKELYDRFDLLYIDTAYRSEEGGIDRLSEHLSAYVEENLRDNQSGLVRVSLMDTRITEVELASDHEGGDIMKQAVSYIEDFGETKYTEILDKNSGDPDFDPKKHKDFLREWDEHLAELRNVGLGGNPAERVREMSYDRQYLLLQGTSGSLYKLNYSDVPSKRQLEKGSHIGSSSANINSHTDNDIFVEYLMQKLGCYTEDAGEQALRCELEYMLFGKLSDKENLEEVFDALLSHREEINRRIFENSPDMIEEAERIAKDSLPEDKQDERWRLINAVKYAWVYAEAFIEVNRMLCGGQCSTKPLRSCVILPVDELLRFPEYLGGDGGKGLTYKEYLGLMLRKCSVSENRKRFMDIVEMDIRRKENDLFRIDRCVEYIQAECFFQCGYGLEKRIQRAAAY